MIRNESASTIKSSRVDSEKKASDIDPTIESASLPETATIGPSIANQSKQLRADRGSTPIKSAKKVE